MIEPTEAQVAALALPGDDWEAGRARARRLLNAVEQCVPCPDCGGQSFLDGVHNHCYGCPGAPALRDYPNGGFDADD